MTGKPLTDVQLAAARASYERMLAGARARKRIGRYRLHAALVLPLIGLLRVLPVEVASNIGGAIGRRMIGVFGDADEVRRTMRVPFPDKTDAELDVLRGDMSENIGRVVGELTHLEAFSGADNPRLALKGVEHMRAAQAAGRGIVFVSGHFGNWELFEVALANLRLDGAKVMQHPSNPFVLERLAYYRYAHGLDEQIAAGEGVFRRVRAALEAGRVVQMLADQGPSKGAKVPFFGLETTTNLLPARVAKETGAPIVLMSMRRLGPARFEIVFHPPRSFGLEDDEVAIMRWVNSFYEDELRARPAHWLWAHPRWNDAFENTPAQPLITPPPGS